MKKKPSKLVIVLSAIAVLAALLVAALWLAVSHVMVGWHFYPKGRQQLDVRRSELTVEDFRVLQRRLPETKLVWNVPFQDGSVSSDSAEVTFTQLSDEDVDILDYLTDLKVIHAEQCTDYAQMAELRRRHPDSEMMFSMQLGNKSYTQQDTSVRVPELDAEQAKLLECFANLKTVDADGCVDYALLDTLAQEHPQWDIRYQVHIAGQSFDRNAVEITVAKPTYDELNATLSVMPNLQKVDMTNPDATAKQLKKLRKTYSNLDINWTVDVCGKTFNSEAKTVDISGIQVDSIETVKEAVKSLPKIKKLVMSDCGISNKDMAAFREEMREQYKVVWTVHIGKRLKVRTDDTMFMPISQGEYYFGNKMKVTDLQYCEDLVCVDVGDAPALKDVSWAAYMPHLKYLILANSSVNDISALSNCKELIYLEIDGCRALLDYSPLIGCTALEDVNLSRTFGKADPFCQMPWLKNLFWENCNGKKQMMLKEALPDTRLVFQHLPTATGMGWRNLPNYYGQRDYLGKPYMD